MPTGGEGERRFNRRVVGGIALGFLLLLAAAAGALLTVAQNRQNTLWVNHTYQVQRQLSLFRVLLERAEAGRRGLLLVDDPRIRQTLAETLVDLPAAFDRTARLIEDNPRQRMVVARARPLLAEEVALLHQTVALVRAGRGEAAVADFRSTHAIGLLRALRTAAAAMLAEEDRLLALRNAAQAASFRRFILILGVAGVLLVLVAAGTVAVILGYTRALRASQDELSRLNDGLEEAVRVRTTDLSRANEEIQRFAYIVSHDLRSPLVNVMGFTAELEAAAGEVVQLIARADAAAPGIVTADARLAATEDLPEAIGFIRTSTAKMDRLINAILRLSREGRRQLSPEPLDMDALVQGVADTLHHRAVELGVAITLARPLPAITGDRLAVEQIFANILENALKYLQPGRPGTVRISATREGPRAVFAVADNGRGIDPRDHQRIFDLFRRSGVQDQPGEGIGLAHTRALAYRLGGGITVQSVLGDGATFFISLPVRFAGDKEAP